MRTLQTALAVTMTVAAASAAVSRPAGAHAQIVPAPFAPAQRIVGSAPALPSPTTVGWIEEAAEVTVNTLGYPTAIAMLKGTPGSRLLEAAVRDWVFRPATLNRLPVESRLLVVGVFRPRLSINGPTLGSPPIVFGVGSREVPSATRVVVPAYPPTSVAEGVAVVQLLVSPEGRVQSATIVNAAAGLDAAALDAARAWTFAPALRDGQPVPASVYAVFGFQRPVT